VTRLSIGLAIGALTVVACNRPPSSARIGAGVDSAGVGAVRDRLSRNLVLGDASAVMADYSDSAVFVGAGSPTLMNRGPLTAFLKGMYAAVTVTRFDIHPVRVIGHDGMLTEIGTQYEVAAETGKPAQESWGRYLLAWIKSPSGQWEVAFDMAIDDSTRAVGTSR
jgi:ketosteroid isomerase-like protein